MVLTLFFFKLHHNVSFNYLQASSKLENLQRQMNKPVHELIQAVETRWNSEYLMLERLLEQREPLSAELSTAKIDGFSNSEWKLVSGSLAVFRRPYASKPILNLSFVQLM